MATQIKNLTSEQIGSQIVISVNGSRYYSLPFYKTEIDFRNETQRNKFIHAVEDLVRKSPLYRAYILYLKEKIGLKNCMMFSEIDDSMCNIEMHHGPIFTLYDYVTITLTYFIKNNLEISSFAIAKQILEDHCNNLIQVVMLSEMAHKAIHVKSSNIKSEFLDINSAWGDLIGYITKYHDYMSVNHYNKINKYLKEYMEKSTNKSEIFITKIKKWNEFFM